MDTLIKLNISVAGIFFRKERACKKYGKIRLYLGVPDDDPWLEARKCTPGETFVRPLFWNSGPSLIRNVATSKLIPHWVPGATGKEHSCSNLLKAYATQLSEKEGAQQWEAMAEVLFLVKISQGHLVPSSNEAIGVLNGGSEDSDDDSHCGTPRSNEEIEALLNEVPTPEERPPSIWDSDSDSDSDDEDENREPLRPGDVIEYNHLVFVAGTNLCRGKVISINKSRDPMLVLDNGDVLPPETRVRRARVKASTTNVHIRLNNHLTTGAFHSIEEFELEDGVLEGHSNAVSAGYAKESKRIGSIIKKNMNAFQKTAEEEGFAPMDVMNKYKGVDYQSIPTVATTEDAVIVVTDSPESGGTQRRSRFKYEMKECPCPALEGFEVVDLAHRPRSSTTGSSPSLEDLKRGGWADIEFVNVTGALIFNDCIKRGKNKADFLPASPFNADSIQSRNILQMDQSQRYCSFAYHDSHFWLLDVIPQYRIIIAMQGLNDRNPNEIETYARPLLRKYGLDGTKTVRFQYILEEPADRRIKRLSFPAKGDNSVWMVMSSSVFNKLVTNALCLLHKKFALRPVIIQRGGSACGFFALSGLEVILTLEDGDTGNEIVIEGDEHQRMKVLQRYEDLIEAGKRNGSLIPRSSRSRNERNVSSSQTSEAIAVDGDDDKLPIPLDVSEDTSTYRLQGKRTSQGSSITIEGSWLYEDQAYSCTYSHTREQTGEESVSEEYVGWFALDDEGSRLARERSPDSMSLTFLRNSVGGQNITGSGTCKYGAYVVKGVEDQGGGLILIRSYAESGTTERILDEGDDGSSDEAFATHIPQDESQGISDDESYRLEDASQSDHDLSDLDASISLGLEDQLKATAKQLDLVLDGCDDFCKTKDYGDDYSADSDPDINTSSLAEELQKADRGKHQDNIGKRLHACSAHASP